MKRVVVTGMAAITPLGNDWDKYKGLNTRLGARVDFSRPGHYSRKQARSMGPLQCLQHRL